MKIGNFLNAGDEKAKAMFVLLLKFCSEFIVVPQYAFLW
jgi:hypothetical protein